MFLYFLPPSLRHRLVLQRMDVATFSAMARWLAQAQLDAPWEGGVAP
jgi:hypothetical protein